MTKKDLTKLKCYSKLLKNKEVKQIFELYYPEYKLKEIKQNYIVLSKENDLSYEVIEMFEGPYINYIKCEQRPKGLIITKTEYIFSQTAYSNGKSILVRLLEKRLVLTNDKLKTTVNTNGLGIKLIYEKIKRLPLILLADMRTNLIINKNYMVQDIDGKLVKSYLTPTRVFLNNEDVSYIYDSITGNDNLYRIYDLYCGILSNKNEQDIKRINLGVLSTDSFDLKTLRGIYDKEDELVGKSIQIPNENYINYITNFFYNNFGYSGEVNIDRESLLKGITYKTSSKESEMSCQNSKATDTDNKVLNKRRVGMYRGFRRL